MLALLNYGPSNARDLHSNQVVLGAGCLELTFVTVMVTGTAMSIHVIYIFSGGLGVVVSCGIFEVIASFVY